MPDQKFHILIIDDDAVMLRLMGGKLAKAGFEVLYSQDSHQGREMARRLQPDLILLDIRMPVMDGYQTLGRLKSEKLTARIPVVFLTNEDLSPDAEQKIKELGAVDYIHKSIDPDRFVEKVKNLLEKAPQTAASSPENTSPK